MSNFLLVANQRSHRQQPRDNQSPNKLGDILSGSPSNKRKNSGCKKDRKQSSTSHMRRDSENIKLKFEDAFTYQKNVI